MLETFLLIELSVNWTGFKEIRILIDVGIDFGPRKTDRSLILLFATARSYVLIPGNQYCYLHMLMPLLVSQTKRKKYLKNTLKLKNRQLYSH